MDIPILFGSDVPHVTTEQMVEVDRAMVEDYQIELIQMMESAGRNLAHLARMRFLNGHPGGKRIAVLAGTGGNGGGALVCARRLSNWGANVRVYITKTEDAFTPVPAHQLDILHRMHVTVEAANAVSQLATPDLIVDGIIGYSLSGAPRGTAADLIRWANDQTTPVLSLDAPSGVDNNSGAVFDPAIRAAATMTLALPKAGLQASGAAANLGELYLADISVPPALYAEPALQLKVGAIFAQSEIIRLRFEDEKLADHGQ
ncbi:MAG: NAD(P)H-hydrate epimerase [Desulfosarcina sp.]